MRLLLIHQAFVGPSEAGGTRHFELAKHAVAQGHEVTIVASDRSYLTGRRATQNETGSPQDSEMCGVRVLRVRTHSSLHVSYIRRVLLFLDFMVSSAWTAMKAGDVDLVMGTSPPIFQAVSAWAVSALKRRPFLLEIRDLWPEFAIGMGVLKNPLLIGLTRRLERFLYQRATHLVVNSPAYRDYLLEKGIAASKISLIPNGVGPQEFKPDSTGKAVRQQWGLNGNFVVTYAGALGSANDISTLLRAAARLRSENDIHFLLVGDGKERHNLEEEAQRLNLSNITFTGVCSKSEIPEILAASDVCVAILKDIPMFRTTYPNKVFDYMAAARPTILAIDGVIRDVIEKSGGGIFVQPADDEALARAVLTIHRNRGMGRTMGRSARDYVARHFDRGVQAQDFVALVENICVTRAV